jgi:hypothetical protein
LENLGHKLNCNRNKKRSKKAESKKLGGGQVRIEELGETWLRR